jgi:glycine cleavage system H lipoate-binding protein
MDDLEHLPPNMAALIMRLRQKFGTPSKGWRYPTNEEAMEEDRELNAQRETSAWFCKLKVDDWKINGIPLSSLD